MLEEVKSSDKYLLEQGWTLEEIRNYEKLMREGKSPTEAYKDVKTPEEVEEEISEESEEQLEPEDYDILDEGEKPDFLQTKETVKSGLQKTKEYTKEALKGALISGASAIESLVTPKKAEKGAREVRKEIPRKVKYVREKEPVRSREPSIKDIGKGSMGSERYEPFQPDFFGTKSQFDIGLRSPMGRPSRETVRSRPPSTTIPFGGLMPPSTSIPYGGSRPPSTSIPFGGSKPPSTSFPVGRGRVSTKVPIVRGRPPSTKFRGVKKVSTRVSTPKNPPKTVKPLKTLTLKEIQPGKPPKIKTKIKVQKDAVDILGLKGYF